MNKCIVCGAEFDSPVRFCAVCGAKFEECDEVISEHTVEEPDVQTIEPASENVETVEAVYDSRSDVVPLAENIEEFLVDEAVDSDGSDALGFVEDYVCESSEQHVHTFGEYIPQKHRSGTWWKVLLAVTAGVLALIMTFLTIVTVYFPMAVSMEYSKGEIENGVYVNEFADLYFELDTRWKNASKSEYKTREDANGENGECGLVVTRDSTKLIVTYFSGVSGSDGEEILKSMSSYKDEKSVEKAILDDIILERGDLDDYSVSVDVKSIGNVEEIEIAGSDYAILSVECDIILDGTTYKLYHSICARVIGDYAVVIQVSSDSERGAESALKSFKTIPFEYYYDYEYYYDDEDAIEGAY